MISSIWEIEKKLTKVVSFYKLDKLFCRECNKLDLDYEVYLVGGFIRNLIFENKIDNELDIVFLLKNNDISVYKGAILKICTDCYKGYNYKLIELDTNRYIYRIVIDCEPRVVIDTTYTTDLFQDAIRRDFTINSLYFSIFEKKLIDLTDSLKDIENKILRAYRLENLTEDPLRILRAIRFKNKYNLNIEDNTLKYIQENISSLLSLNHVRVKQELFKIFELEFVFKALVDFRLFGISRLFNLEPNDDLIESVKILDLTFDFYKELLIKEYDLEIYEKSKAVSILIMMSLINNEIIQSLLNYILGENIYQKAKKLIELWNKRDNKKILIEIFKHKKNYIGFEFIYYNFLLNLKKLNNRDYLQTLEKLLQLCRYVCQFRRKLLSFDEFKILFNDNNYENYVDYLIKLTV
jgi:tRNA nucleotidyltransferase/poly(A) polymerase